MISASELLHLPYPRDLTEGGIAYALRTLPHGFRHKDPSTYERLRRIVAEAAVELAFRRYLSERAIPFEVKAAPPFAGSDGYDVTFDKRRCEIKSFLIGHPQQILQIQNDPTTLLKSQALVASDQHAAEGYLPRDLYLFAYVTGRVADSQDDLQKVVDINQPHHLVHVMQEAWKRPSKWSPLGKLVLKSESETTQIIEIGGQDEARRMISRIVELPPQTRIEIRSEFFSIAYLHTKSHLPARMGIHSSIRKETHIINTSDWGNIWVHGMDIWFAGYITREEFSRRASFLPAGSRVFPYNRIQVKNLAVPVSELRPFSELLERVKVSPLLTTT